MKYKKLVVIKDLWVTTPESRFRPENPMAKSGDLVWVRTNRFHKDTYNVFKGSPSPDKPTVIFSKSYFRELYSNKSIRALRTI